MAERIDDLTWGDFRLIQNPDWFCFSLDAVILSWYAGISPGDRVLDLGSGNGVLPLLLLAREKSLQITGLELMAPLADLARRNMEMNRVDVEIVCGDICRGTELFPKASFDLVVSNPPYEKMDHGRLPKEPLKAAARAEVYCDLHTVVETAATLLKPLGRFAIVHRAKRLAEVIYEAKSFGLEPKTLLLIAPKPGEAANLLFMEAVKGGKPGLLLPAPLIVYGEDGEYTEEMKKVFRGPEGGTGWK